ncbi:MAG: hypothetical protein OXT65_09675 [Alphaproteobacteria bacterium]|nr:hypothetical protein [Alphaproteobacteria bacterium]
MKKLFIALAAVVFLAATPVLAAEYFSAVEDLPLMEGMQEDPSHAVVFDAPSGRIVDVAATVGADPAHVSAFYKSSLPALGWTPSGKDVYHRNGEKLLLVTVKNGDATSVRIHISPAP